MRCEAREGSAHPLFGPLYLALGVGFLTVAIPIKLESYWNTLGWIVEAGALFWAAHRAARMLLRILGSGAFLLGVGRLIWVDSFSHQPLLINPRFGLYLVAIAALAVLAYFAISEGGAGNRQWAGAAIIGINLLALVALHFEVMGYFQPQLAAAYSGNGRRSIVTVRDFAYSAVWMAYGGGLMLVGFWKRSGLHSLAGHRSAGDDRVQGVCDRHQHAGARLSHRCVHRPGRDSAGRVVLLSAQPDAYGGVVTVALHKKKHRAARRCFIPSSRQTHFRPVTSLTINVKITAPITATMMV